MEKNVFSPGFSEPLVYFSGMVYRPRINFDNIYPFEFISDDLRTAAFHTKLRNGEIVKINIKISETPHELMPNVYNLSFGPLINPKRINDRIELPHSDYSKVFSTILTLALKYISANPNHYLGIDGSENLRAWYYWRTLQSNFGYLNDVFDMYGLKYFVRISRFGKLQYANPFDFEDIQMQYDKIIKIDTWPEQMYNYFILGLKNTYLNKRKHNI